jgi:endogenous inhibitor of DNA gyrase (YacG/DUF329 family)
MIRLPECPICGKSVPPVSDPGASFSPFCSRRCKEVDLIRWCEGRYLIVESIDQNRLETEKEGAQSKFDEFSEQGIHDDLGDYDD